MRRTLRLVALCLLLCPAWSDAQGTCTIRNLVGSYAVSTTGTSAIVPGPAADGFHWNALYAPIAGTGVFTITPEGYADGYFWMVSGQLNFGLTPLPMHSKVTVNPDCTGEFEGTFGESTIREAFVVIGNGRELRAVATQTAMPTGTWLTRAVRLTGACHHKKIRGDYLLECRNLFPLPPHGIFAGSIQIRMTIDGTGDYTGRVYGKVGPLGDPFDVYGHIDINSDCSAAGTLASAALPAVSQGRGVFYDNGKRGFWVPLVGLPPDGEAVPQPYGYCEFTRVEHR